MAKTNRRPGVEVGHAGRRQRQSRRTYTVWERACRDAKRRSELYSEQSTQEEAEAQGWGFVYIMKDATGASKVGHSTNLPRRIIDLQTGLWGGVRPIQLVRAIQLPTPAMWAAERYTRRALRKRGLLIRGEWFRTSPAAASRVLNGVLQQLKVERAWMF